MSAKWYYLILNVLFRPVKSIFFNKRSWCLTKDQGFHCPENNTKDQMLFLHLYFKFLNHKETHMAVKFFVFVIYVSELRTDQSASSIRIFLNMRCLILRKLMNYDKFWPKIHTRLGGWHNKTEGEGRGQGVMWDLAGDASPRRLVRGPKGEIGWEWQGPVTVLPMARERDILGEWDRLRGPGGKGKPLHLAGTKETESVFG